MYVVVGDTKSHEALSEAVSVATVDVPVETDIVWLDGFGPPCTAENVNAVLLVVNARPSEANPRQMNAVITRACPNHCLVEASVVRRDGSVRWSAIKKCPMNLSIGRCV